jgi:dihydroxyacetone kinase-like predicted kinase
MAGRSRVFILPNHPNVLLAARQAAAQEPARLAVVPATSMPAGLAAAVAFEPEGDPDSVVAAMERAASTVRAVEVTRATRDTMVEGLRITGGDAIAFVDDRLVARGETLEEAAIVGLRAARAEECELATVYRGADASESDCRRLAERIAECFPRIETQVVEGGQPHYPYVIGVE